MRLLLLGGTGMLGGAVSRYFLQAEWEVVAPNSHDYDVAGGDLTTLALSRYDFVVNACGMINRRLSSALASKFWEVNATFPLALADACERAHVPLIHISTDCVFDGSGGPRIEADRPDAQDLYGRSKAAGEPPNALTIRTSIVGPESRNFYSLLCWSLSQSDLTGYTDHHWNGLSTLELAKCLLTIFRKRLIAPGVRHLFGEDVTKAQLLLAIKQAFKSASRIQLAASGCPRDLRLRTAYSEFLLECDVQPLEVQLAQLALYADDRGHWSAL